ncbi:UDP-glucosyltransferase 2-like [Nymphalis io]|uniref:UDP-glucosyltransferase 2-like n=1 Tax=Inachis io TaxID=171585 RepID=UPI002167A4C3|nr:UDP-glucosyltransferase 2-like [Nymphalis io]
MYSNTLRIAILLIIPFNVISLNILSILPYHGKSHFFVFKVYLQELAKRGHNVTVISHFPQDDPPKNYHDISLAGSIDAIEDNLPFHRSFFSILEVGIYLTNSGKVNCDIMLANKDVQKLVKDKPKFDVIVVEQFNSDCALGIAYKLQAPVVGIMSHILMPWHYNRFGIPNNPSFVPFHFLEGGTKPTLLQKIQITILDVYFKTMFYIFSQRNNQQTLAQYYDDIPPLEDLAREIKFLLIYHNFILTGSRLFPANVIEVGGYHVKETKPLTGDLLKFIEEAEHGVVYISFGSVVRSSTMPEDKVKAVLEAIAELPQRFIWKWENENMLLNKNKLYLSNWLPQVDILGHPKTLAFLSHAGMGSTTEAIHFGVPMVAMPVIGDQPANAAAIEESGLGVQLQIKDLTKDNLVTAFKKVLDPTFRKNAKLLSKAWHDRPMPPLDTAIYWTEFAARYPNMTFRTAAADIPCYQYYNLDVIGIFAMALLLTIYMLKCIVFALCSKNRKTNSTNQEHPSKNKNKKRSKRE